MFTAVADENNNTSGLKDIATSVTTPVIEIVGVATIASLKVAVMVTVSDADKRLSESVLVRVTVGEV